MPYYIGIDL